MSLSNRQHVFIEEYLNCWNASEAARRAGYKSRANTAGERLLSNVDIQQAIQTRIDEKAMSADEVLTRLAHHARGSMEDFLDVNTLSFDLSLPQAKERGMLDLIKKIKQRTVTTISKDGEEREENFIELELYDAQAALVQIGRHHKLFTDNTDITSQGDKIIVTLMGKDENR